MLLIIIMISEDTNPNCYYKVTVMRPSYQKRDLKSDATKPFFFFCSDLLLWCWIWSQRCPRHWAHVPCVCLCQCSQERRTSGCSGTQWWTPQGRPKRRPKAWLRRHLSRRSPSSMSDRTSDATFTLRLHHRLDWTGFVGPVNLDLLNFVSFFRSHRLGRKHIT